MTLRAVPHRPAPPEIQVGSDTVAAESPLVTLSGWGRHPVVEGHETLSEDLERITRGAVLTRGLGRSYGDASLPPPGRHRVAGSVLADRLLAFDPDTGIVRAEAGLPAVARSTASSCRAAGSRR